VVFSAPAEYHALTRCTPLTSLVERALRRAFLKRAQERPVHL